ncbi:MULTISPECIES: site-specific DNA-methyltransferase [unclassified Bacillus (in: firmicutes)]|uniref:DNA-methyltransferase n=1 Tax=unclassified Bacillus (in: firmicutes) TaxID=185979 RepID=UPI0008E06029|nr:MULTISPECIES: site-specific DNA-methyltransferase [unclassified Bacillus (in: firmicutes)]SFA86485.1 site-specific DNA-methyltransferase (adenine-specific) [Bacillus sp. UNCCL13]SFQ83721.1 site-specific DNA-methyltransferase (adenine-specific) [Bacillus sp. cl95]
MEEFLNKTHKTDCSQGFQDLYNNYGSCIDLIIADPPYVVSKESNFHTMKDRKKQRTGTSFGDWDVEFDNADWILNSFKVLKDGGSLIVFNDFKKASLINDIATNAGFSYKDTIIWQKTNPMPRNRDRRYIPNIEMIQWYVKKGKWAFNRQNPKYEGSILSYPSESGGGFKRYHPTQKPVKLLEHLIRIHSNENDLVLDPFMGSGTTAVASINMNRSFIGFEINSEYVEISNMRTENIQMTFIES